MSEKYAYDYWVFKNEHKERDDNVENTKYFSNCSE